MHEGVGGGRPVQRTPDSGARDRALQVLRQSPVEQGVRSFGRALIPLGHRVIDAPPEPETPIEVLAQTGGDIAGTLAPFGGAGLALRGMSKFSRTAPDLSAIFQKYPHLREALGNTPQAVVNVARQRRVQSLPNPKVFGP